MPILFIVGKNVTKIRFSKLKHGNLVTRSINLLKVDWNLGHLFTNQHPLPLPWFFKPLPRSLNLWVRHNQGEVHSDSLSSRGQSPGSINLQKPLIEANSFIKWLWKDSLELTIMAVICTLISGDLTASSTMCYISCASSIHLYPVIDLLKERRKWNPVEGWLGGGNTVQIKWA